MLFLTIICNQPYPVAENMDADVAIGMFFHMMKRLGDGFSYLVSSGKRSSNSKKGEYVPDVRDAKQVIKDAISKLKKKKKKKARQKEDPEKLNIFKRAINKLNK